MVDAAIFARVAALILRRGAGLAAPAPSNREISSRESDSIVPADDGGFQIKFDRTGVNERIGFQNAGFFLARTSSHQRKITQFTTLIIVITFPISLFIWLSLIQFIDRSNRLAVPGIFPRTFRGLKKIQFPLT
ncbi:MAG TPA: hypothetical protein VIK59_02195 [Verrucomicrobiae bacterium]